MDNLWVLIAAALVFTMQAGFLCLESGLVRSKNSINVATKNITDFVVSSALFWMVSFGLMFGSSQAGWVGTDYFFLGHGEGPNLITFFLFQMMFCGTAATLVSGAVAERMTFNGYLVVTIVITLLIYPITGHWAWAGAFEGESTGWLGRMGFVDFAGSTVVHSVGGWVALAAVLIIGPRVGRYEQGDRGIPGSNLPMAALGCLLLWFGWFGFNGGSTLSWNDHVPMILLNTCLGAAFGGIGAGALSFFADQQMKTPVAINGVIGGLVSITANCHAVTADSAALIGFVGGTLVYVGEVWMARWRIDDAIGVVPAHLIAGIWGTVAVALFGDKDLLGTGLNTTQQLQVQLLGTVAIGVYSFGVAYAALWLLNKVVPLRVSHESELMGLNVAEHNVSTEVFDLLSAMKSQQVKSDFTASVPVEPFTEVGQIAQEYNRVIQRVNAEIQQRDQAFEAFRESEYRNGAILQAAMDCIISINSKGLVLEFNPAAEQCFGSSKRHMQGSNFFSTYLPQDQQADALQSLATGFTSGDGLVLKRNNVVRMHRANGEEFTAEVVITQTTDSRNPEPEFTLYIRDITQQMKLRDRLQFLAYNDVLTGLSNRSHFVDQLKRRIARYKKQPGTVALMFIDLDRFKQINDTLGHKAGDALLCQVAERLNAVVREQDMVGRWGGDEFVLMLAGNITIENVFQRAEILLNKTRDPVELQGKNFSILCSIGIALSINGEIDADRLLQHADLAMYKAKQEGRNNYQLFSEALESEARQQFQLKFAIPEAIEQQQFFLEYQPKVLCENGQLQGFEALLRWQHPEMGRVPPTDFIPMIDGSGLIVDVGEWVIEETFRQLHEWQQQQLPLFPVAINLSGRHLHSPSLVPFIQAMSEKYSIAPELLEVEITEGVLVDNSEHSVAVLGELKSLGINLAIDDFGTGYSSLSYLKRFPVDVLKIDRAFVSECAINSEDAAICNAIIAVANSIGLFTVAEGVEENEQLDFLRELGCDAFQGYLFSRPLKAKAVPQLLQKYSS